MWHVPSDGPLRRRAAAPGLLAFTVLVLVGCTTPVTLKTEAASSAKVSAAAPVCVDRGQFLRAKRLGTAAIAEAVAALHTSPPNRKAATDALRRAVASLGAVARLTEQGQATVGQAFSRAAQALRGAATSALAKDTDVALRRIERATLALTLGDAHVSYDDYC